jgi:hypothetical protein
MKGVLWKYRVSVVVEQVDHPHCRRELELDGTVKAPIERAHSLVGMKALRRSLHDACNRIAKRWKTL